MRSRDALRLLGWEVINPIVLGLNKGKQYRFNSSYAGINLGCGLSSPPNWLGIDAGVFLLLRKVPRPIAGSVWKLFNVSNQSTFECFVRTISSMSIIHHDLVRGIPFGANTIPAIYSSHFLEHLFRDEATELIGECYRVLQPGGIIRICVPSLGEECRRMREAINAFENGDIEKIQPFVTSGQVGYNNEYRNHRVMYDYSEVRKVLSHPGFVDISEKSFGVGEMPDVESLDTRSGLFVEAIKPCE